MCFCRCYCCCLQIVLPVLLEPSELHLTCHFGFDQDEQCPWCRPLQACHRGAWAFGIDHRLPDPMDLNHCPSYLFTSNVNHTNYTQDLPHDLPQNIQNYNAFNLWQINSSTVDFQDDVTIEIATRSFAHDLSQAHLYIIGLVVQSIWMNYILSRMMHASIHVWCQSMITGEIDSTRTCYWTCSDSPLLPCGSPSICRPQCQCQNNCS